MHTLITGATGLIGRELVSHIESAVVLSRDPASAMRKLPSVRAVAWEPEAGPPPPDSLRGIDVVFNLAGEPVGEGRWSKDKKRRIRDSRVLGTRNLVAGLAAMKNRPQVLVSASAVGFYGDRGDEELDEGSAVGSGFLAEVCADWEREALAARQLGIRVVCVRNGIVLAPGGGTLPRMIAPFRKGFGGRLGNGKQWMPWIDIEDAVGLLLHASRTALISGPMNAVGPHPVTNAEFTNILGYVLHRPVFLPAPKAALRVVFGEMSAILIASQRVFPRVAERSSYSFLHTSLENSLERAVAAMKRRRDKEKKEG